MRAERRGTRDLRDPVEQSERPSTGVSRSQHVLHIVPQLWEAITPVVTGALERVDPDAAEPQLLVITPDNDTAMDVARLAAALPAANGRRIVPVSEGGRAARLLKARPAPVVIGSAVALAELVSATALKLAGLKAVLFVWAEEVVERTPPETLDALLTEVPREAARLATAGVETPELEAFVERQMFRARRAGESRDAGASTGGAPFDVEVLTVPAGNRAATLARLLDEVDPPSAAVVTRAEETADEAREALALLGYTEEDVQVVTGAPEESVAVAVMYEAPLKRDELDALRDAGVQRVIVFASAREGAHLRGLLAGGKARPLQLGATAKKAREREERLRGELRAQLEAGVAPRELLALEPLAAEYDALEIAAAALRLMERARQSKAGAGAAAGVVASAGATERSAHTTWKRVFMTLGTMDGASPRDVVGAVLNEGNLAKEQVGKVEMRDSHTLVEVAADQAERVATALDGKTIRGRRINARLDMDRSEREGRGERPPRGDRPERGDRPPRSVDRDRGDRGDGPPRAGGFSRDRGDRPSRPGGFSRDRGERSERPARGGFDRDRGERPARSGGFDRDRPPRSGGFDRDRGERPPRAGGFDRDRGERPPRSGGFDRDRGGDRPRGGGGGGGYRGREDGPRNTFGGGPREVGGERVDFNERAERMRRAKRTPRPRTEGWSPAEGDDA